MTSQPLFGSSRDSRLMLTTGTSSLTYVARHMAVGLGTLAAPPEQTRKV
jgi:hypothetical protein